MIKQFFILSISLLMLSSCAKKEPFKLISVEDIVSTEDKKIDISNNTTIYDAVRINDLELTKVFIKKGIDINQKDKFGYTPLHLAARFNHFEILKYLLDNNALVNTSDKYGDTPLLDSTRNGYTKVSQNLICKGAKIDIKDKTGFSPLDYALKNNDVKIATLIKSNDIPTLCGNNRSKNLDLLSIDTFEKVASNKPRICGDILDNTVYLIQLTLNDGKDVINATLNPKNQKWCVDVKERLSNGNYLAKVMAINKDGKTSLVEQGFEVKVKNSIYGALEKEFQNDFKKWDIELLDENNTIRFKNPALMFSRGSNDIKDSYKEILDEFLPRYIKVIEQFKNNIKNVYIEGHTSSRYRTAKTVQEKFEKNRILSQKRADSVLMYLKSSESETIKNNSSFINNNFKAVGKSSADLIYDYTGAENIELSRRVEFIIESK